MPTVSEEMPAEERRTRLLHGLKSTGVEEVGVDFSHLAHALDMETAEKISDGLVEMQAIGTSSFSKKPKLQRNGLCNVNRQQVIDLLEPKIAEDVKKADAEAKKTAKK